MKLATCDIDGLTVSYRAGTADETVLDLVLARNRYGFPDNMDGKVVVDIGAHIGSATMLCASRGAIVLAYEPAHDNYLICRRNIRQNKLRAWVYELAVGVPGQRVFYLNPANTASNGERAIQTGDETGYEAAYATWVSLHTVFNKISFCDFLKMDCEGGEIDVIPQIVELHDRIRVVVGEVHAGQWPHPTPDLDRQINDAVGLLDEHYVRSRISGCEYRWDHR